jgi:hypothetical protein
MLYKRRNERDQLCVFSVSPDVLDLPEVVITDGNASGNYVRFAAEPGGLEIVNRDLTFADNWTDPDQIQYFRKKAAKCAEVLVPDRVDPRYLRAAYVWNEAVLRGLQAGGYGLRVKVNGHLFFA